MTPQKINGGYLVVRLKNNGKSSTKVIHGLVAKAFIPNPENKTEVNHKDLDKSNNCVDNLEWNTRSENMKHAFDNGVVNIENLGRRNVAEDDVVNIRKRRKNGERRGVVYKDYEDLLSIEGFKNIWYEINWKHIKI